MNKSAIRSAARQGIARAAYRALINTALLVALFHDFPDHQTVAIFAVVAFSQGIGWVGLVIGNNTVVQNAIADAGERKTRHTILLASDPDWLHAPEFWPEVSRRVEAESDPDDPSPWYAQIGLTVASFLGLLAGDIMAVVFALVISALTAS